MAIQTLLRWRNPDKTLDLNNRFKTVFNKGVVDGGLLTPVSGQLEVEVAPFTAVSFDGAVIHSDDTETVVVPDGEDFYIVLNARWRFGDSPIQVLQAITLTDYGLSAEQDWMIILGRIDTVTGAPNSEVDAADITYVERMEVDPQGRSSWRGVIATAGSLPSGVGHTNKDGDVRLVRDTGSFYFWNETGGTWDLFDEVPITTHRDAEHSNGVTGDSASTTLAPTAVGTDITIAAVAAGSSYTVDGRLLTAPGGTTTIGAATVGAIRGLIQVAVNNTPVVAGTFRVQKDVDSLDIAAARIVDMSDNHATGTFGLIFNNTGNLLSWDNGEPVDVTVAGRYRLFRADYTQWIDVQVTGSLPGSVVSDNYVVNASAQTDTSLLIAHYFWDGSTTLVLGADRRIFGNTGPKHVSTDAKQKLSYDALTDLRGSMVFSGGDCDVITGLNLRVMGPVIAYMEGRRYVAAGNYTGIAIPAASTRYVYVEKTTDDLAALTVSATDPSTVAGLIYAPVASVTTDGSDITSIVDLRDPQVIVGQATRHARLRMTREHALKFSPGTGANGTYSLENTDTGVESAMSVGRMLVSDTGEVSATGGGLFAGLRAQLDLGRNANNALRFRDTNTGLGGDWQNLTDATANSLADFQPLRPTPPSVFGTLLDIQTGTQTGEGVVTGFAAAIGAGLSVDLALGEAFDVRGRRLETDSVTNVAIPAAGTGDNDTVWAIAWNPAIDDFEAVKIGTATGAADGALVIALATLNNTGGGPDAVAAVTDVRRFAAGSMGRMAVTVGAANANFPSMRQALLNLNALSTSAIRPSVLLITGDYTEPFVTADGGCILIDDTNDAVWTGAGSKLSNIHIAGAGLRGAVGQASPNVTWGGTGDAGFFLDFNNAVRNWTFENLSFVYAGDAAVAPVNHDVCLFKNTSFSFTMHKCSLNGNSKLTHVFAWAGNVALGGGESTTGGGLLLDRVVMTNVGRDNTDSLGATGADVSPFYFAASTSITGQLQLRDTIIRGNSTQAMDSVVFSPSGGSTGSLFLSFQGVSFTRVVTGVTSGVADASKSFQRCSFGESASAYAISSGATTLSRLSECRFTSTGAATSLEGVAFVSGCSTSTGAVVTGASTAVIVGCDFKSAGSFTGAYSQISGAEISLGTTGVLTPATQRAIITGSEVVKANGDAQSNTMVSVTGNLNVRFSNTTFTYSGTSTNTDNCVEISGTTPRVAFVGCALRVGSARPDMGYVVRVTSTSAFNLMVHDCDINGGSTSGGGILFSRSSGTETDGEFHISGGYIQTSTGAAIIVSHNATGSITAGSIEGVYINTTAAGFPCFIQRVRHLSVNGVTVRAGAAATIQFGNSTVADSTFQRDLALVGNTFFSESGDMTVSVQRYRSVNAVSNTLDIHGTAVNQNLIFLFEGSNITETLNIVANQLFINGSANANTLARIDVTDAGRVLCGQNQVFVDADGSGTATAEIRITADDRTSSIFRSSGNTLEASSASGVAQATLLLEDTSVGSNVFAYSENDVLVTRASSANGTSAIRVEGTFVGEVKTASVVGDHTASIVTDDCVHGKIVTSNAYGSAQATVLVDESTAERCESGYIFGTGAHAPSRNIDVNLLIGVPVYDNTINMESPY